MALLTCTLEYTGIRDGEEDKSLCNFPQETRGAVGGAPFLARREVAGHYLRESALRGKGERTEKASQWLRAERCVEVRHAKFCFLKKKKKFLLKLSLHSTSEVAGHLCFRCILNKQELELERWFQGQRRTEEGWETGRPWHAGGAQRISAWLGLESVKVPGVRELQGQIMEGL